MKQFKKLKKIQRQILIALFALLILTTSFLLFTNRNNSQKNQKLVEEEINQRYVSCSAKLDQTIINTINNPIKFGDITPNKLDEYSKGKKDEYNKISTQVKDEKQIENDCIQKIIDENLVGKISSEDIRIKLSNLFKRRQTAVQKIDESYKELDKLLQTLSDYVNYLKKDNISEAAKIMGQLIGVEQSSMEKAIKENSDKGEADNLIAKYAGDVETRNANALGEMKNSSLDIKEAIGRIA